VDGRILIVTLAALLVSCGGSKEDPLGVGGDRGLAADLRVTVKPEGSGGPARLRRIECGKLGEDAIDPRCRALDGLQPRDLDSVPERTACAQIYGGPATARVTGELGGKPVSASFDLTDACEIARWRKNRRLLGASARTGVPAP
jgi:hypothetical protein